MRLRLEAIAAGPPANADARGRRCARSTGWPNLVSDLLVLARAACRRRPGRPATCAAARAAAERWRPVAAEHGQRSRSSPRRSRSAVGADGRRRRDRARQPDRERDRLQPPSGGRDRGRGDGAGAGERRGPGIDPAEAAGSSTASTAAAPARPRPAARASASPSCATWRRAGAARSRWSRGPGTSIAVRLPRPWRASDVAEPNLRRTRSLAAAPYSGGVRARLTTILLVIAAIALPAVMAGEVFYASARRSARPPAGSRPSFGGERLIRPPPGDRPRPRSSTIASRASAAPSSTTTAHHRRSRAAARAGSEPAGSDGGSGGGGSAAPGTARAAADGGGDS